MQQRDRQRKRTEQAAKIPRSYSSGHKEMPCEFYVCVAVPVNTSQEATEEGGQSSVFDHGEDPGVIDTGICSGKVSQKDKCFLRSTRDMGQSSGLNLKDVIRHLPGGDASL